MNAERIIAGNICTETHVNGQGERVVSCLPCAYSKDDGFCRLFYKSLERGISPIKECLDFKAKHRGGS